MRDVLMLILIVAFFALCIAYVAWCDRIIGPDPDAGTEIRTDVSTDVGKHDGAGRTDVPESARAS